MLIDRGALDVSAPVGELLARGRPEGQGARRSSTFAQTYVRSGGVEQPFTYEDTLGMRGAAARLARQASWWEPGTASAYHASTFGYLLGELVLQ
jgi:CubicO group peptidase (beta-lactamase class C family)